MTSNAELDGQLTASAAGRLLKFLEQQGIRDVALGDARQGLAAPADPHREPSHTDERLEVVADSTALVHLPRTMQDFGWENGLRIVRAVRHERPEWHFVLAGHDDSKRLRFLAVDFRGDRPPSGFPLSRLVKQLSQPAGLWVAFLGPDGSGKSTIIRRLVAAGLGPVFRHTRAYHLRPYFGRSRSTEDGGPPTRGRPRGHLASFAKLLWWWTDYTIGFAIDIFPRLAASTLVLFDRYYLDLHVDPIRYRYGGPAWFARLVGRAIPEPDVYVVLRAPAEVLTERKGELSNRDATSQMDAWRMMASRSKKIRLVDTSTSIEDTVFSIERILLDLLERRTIRRLGLPLRPTGSDFPSTDSHSSPTA